MAIATFGITRLPWLLDGQVRPDEVQTSPAMFRALKVSLTLGMVVILSSLALLYLVPLRPVTPTNETGVALAVGERKKGRSLAATHSR
jgi:hypothetical protein